jgi:hypothetical protein
VENADTQKGRSFRGGLLRLWFCERKLGPLPSFLCPLLQNAGIRARVAGDIPPFPAIRRAKEWHNWAVFLVMLQENEKGIGPMQKNIFSFLMKMLHWTHQG